MSLAGKTFHGYEHLAGKVVSALADNTTLYTNLTVSAGGVITLPNDHTFIYAGLPYSGWLETLNLEGGSRIGNSQASKLRISRVVLKVLRSYGGYLGSQYNNLDPLEYPDRETGYLYSGNVYVDVDMTSDEKRQIIICQDKPFPLSISAIVMKGEVID